MLKNRVNTSLKVCGQYSSRTRILNFINSFDKADYLEAK